MLPGVAFFGGQPVNPGSQTYTTAGTFSFTVPPFNTMTVEVWGGGGSGGSYSSPSNFYSPSGGNSTFHTASAPGGGGGQSAGTSTLGGNPWGAGGAGGTPASGNVTATNGNAGFAGDDATYRGYGAGAPNGGANVAPLYRTAPSSTGSTPGGGGAGWYYDTGGKFPALAGGGGSGAYAKSTFSPTTLNPGTVLSVVVGAGGLDTTGYGGPGAAGKITVTWS